MRPPPTAPSRTQDENLEYSIRHHDRIEPHQIEASYLHEITDLSGQADPTHSLTSLSLTCRQVNDEVCKSGLFYRENDFYFSSPDKLLVYLVAIIPRRREHIRSVTFRWLSIYWGRVLPKETYSFYMLSTCSGLRHLKISANRHILESDLQKSISFLKPLETFSITLLPGESGEEDQDLDEREKQMIATIKKNFMTGHSQRRVVSKRTIIRGHLTALVDIRGEERVVKPDQISSRTRRSYKILEKTGIL